MLLDDPFPTEIWGDSSVTFRASKDLAVEYPCYAAVLFAFERDRFLLADITDRGWCVPGGHLIRGETPLAAVIRETFEETGASLTEIHSLGSFQMTNRDGSIHQVPAFIGKVQNRGEIPEGSESKRIGLYHLDEIPSNYYRWDVLLERVFQLAWNTAHG